MEFKLFMVGKTSMPFIDQGMREFEKRIVRYTKFSSAVLNTPKAWSRLPVSELQKKEGELILQAMKGESYTILLDENGLELHSRDFAEFLQKRMNHVSGSVAFYIGGAHGFSEEVRKQADTSLSLSPMTFSHQVIRLIFLEQFYRAFTILRNEPYHND